MKLFLLILILTLNIFSQEFSIHKQHKLEFQNEQKQPSFFDPEGRDIIPLQENGRDLSRAVFGYLPDWEYLPSRQYLRYDLLTHIGAFDFEVNANGGITNPSYWPWTDVINLAHANGVKVILTAVNFNASDISNILRNATAKQNFFNNVKSRLIQFQLDGVNVDFEGLNTADRGAVLNQFMQDLTNFIKADLPNAEVSFAGPAVNWGGWDFTGLANACDYIFIMGYSFFGSWSTTTGPCAPLTGGSINIANTVNTQYGSVGNTHPHKLILGVPYYGLRWKTQTQNAGSTVISYIGSTRFKNDQVDVQTHGMLWSGTHQTPWYRYQTSGEWYQVWYDNDTSLGLKYNLADAKNYMGIGMWALGYDGARPELWNEIQRRYYFVVPVELTSFTASNVSNNIILNWQTTTETNNLGFYVERSEASLSDNNWIQISFIEGNGTSTLINNYSFIDDVTFLPASKVKYRLKQVDYDGSFNYSNEIEIEILPHNFSLSQNFPNPFNPSTEIRYQIAEAGRVTLKVFDVLGNEIKTLVEELKEPGSYFVDFNGNNFPSGIYYYRLQTGSYSETKKMILLK